MKADYLSFPFFGNGDSRGKHTKSRIPHLDQLSDMEDPQRAIGGWRTLKRFKCCNKYHVALTHTTFRCKNIGVKQ